MLGLLFRKIASGIKALFGLLLPGLGKAGSASDLAGWLRWPLHFLMVAAILVALWWLNDTLDLERLLRAPTPLLRQLWLPLLFLLLYVLCWLGWWLWQLLGIGSEPAEFPDIATAWEEAVRALNDAGIGLDQTPIFLLLGRPLAGEEALFQAARLSLPVHQVPRRPEAPLFVYANRDAIYVTCVGASLVGRQAALLAEAWAVSPKPAPPPEPVPAVAGLLGEVPPALAAAVEPAPAAPLPAHHAIAPASPKSHRPRIDQWAEEADRLSARLRQLCRTIARARAPFCPLNGILVLLPASATESDEDAQQMAALARRDLAAIRETLQVRCPTFAVVCDLETFPGFHELRQRIPQELADRRLGREFPLAPDIGAESIGSMITSGIGWLCRVLLPAAVYRVLQLGDSAAERGLVEGNGRLHQFVSTFGRREGRLARMLTHGVNLQGDGPPLFGGCFLAGTGHDPRREQAFLAGVIERLVECQNFVAWTDEARADESDFNRWTTLGYVGLALALVGAIPLGWLLWPDW